MKQNSIKLKKREKEVLKLILKKGNIRDTEISETLKISKATCSRIRKKLESSLIEGYEPKINLESLGISFAELIVINWNWDTKDSFVKNMLEESREYKNVVFLAESITGNFRATLILVAYDNYEELQEFVRNLLSVYGKYIKDISRFPIMAKSITKNNTMDSILKSLERLE